MTQAVVLASAVRAATTVSPDMSSVGSKALHLSINVTAVPGTDTVTPKIQGKDALGNYYDILAGAAISAVTTNPVVLKIGPGITPAANLAVADILPDIWRVVFTHSAASNFTYTACSNLKAEY